MRLDEFVEAAAFEMIEEGFGHPSRAATRPPQDDASA
jgi:hypothetical protein